MIKVIYFLVALTFGLQGNAFDEAVTDYKKGNYIKALNTFYTLAQEYDAKAQFNVGLIYANGLGVQKDTQKAQTWFEKAAKQGNGVAQYNLAQMYHKEGKKDVHAYEKAKYWYEKSIEAGIKESYNNLGMLYLQGNGVEKNEQKAFLLFQKGAEHGDALAKVNVAILYAWGENITHDKLKAYENLKKALSEGKSEASEYLDKLCQESAWVCKD